MPSRVTTSARSTVELSLNPLFRRDYSALYKAIEEAFAHDLPQSDDSSTEAPVEPLLTALAQVIPAPQARPYLVLGLDATPNPRPYARTLKERTLIYQPNPIKGNKPINIGHPYSILSVLPEKTPHQSGTWVIPLSGVRVWSMKRIGCSLLWNAYVQLWAARSLALNLPRSWERYLPSSVNGQVTPTLVQRDFNRIISQIGTPAKFPKRRGKSPGRAQGNFQTPRPRHPVIKKGSKRSRKTAKAA